MITADTVFLVVDSTDPICNVISSQLIMLGARQILFVSDGQEALQVLQTQRVDLIIFDTHILVMEGLALLREVRADRSLAQLPFIVITTNCELEHVNPVIAAGVSSVLLKPFASQDLARHITRAMQHRPEYQPRKEQFDTRSTYPVAEHNKRRPTLLVVDDMPDNLSLIAGLFMQDYRVRIAQDGLNALAICTSNTPPDLLLLDVMMPDMDGFELVRHLRSHPRASRIPVIFITALTDPETHRSGLELGAVNFVTKPVDPQLLQLRVNNQLRHVEQHKQLQTDYENLLALTRLHEDIEQFARDDLQAPLASILGLVRALLEDGNLMRGQQVLLRLLEHNSLQLLNMLTLTGEPYESETSSLKLQPTEAQVIPLLRRLVELSRKTFEAKGRAPVREADDVADAGQSDIREAVLLNIKHLDNLLPLPGEKVAIGAHVCVAV